MTIILYAIPLFFLLIAVELILEYVNGTRYYRVNDAINSLSAGVLSRVTQLLKALIPLTIYVAVFDHIALFSLPDSIWVGIFAFVAYDFFYYWNHRLGHEMSIFWAAHVVHHSSEEYNLTTALRQTSGSVFSWIFYLPLALAGVSPEMFISIAALNLVYQFWVHTRHIPKLGWFEWFFVSPSNHRVHHAQNQIYLDKNYGGVFIIWDRMFGTFQEELDDVEPIYGVRKALRSWNPIWANFQVYTQLFKDSWRTRRWADKWRVWFGRTGWRPADVELAYPLPRADLTKFQKFDIELSTKVKLYCLLQHVVTVVVALFLLLNANVLTLSETMLVALFVVYSVFSIGVVMEKRSFAVISELCKNAVLLAAVSFTPLNVWLQIGLSSSVILSLGLLFICYSDVIEDHQSDSPLA